MVRHACGEICLALTGERCDELGLPLQTADNTSRHGTNFTVTVDAASGITTGTSAFDRAKTVLEENREKLDAFAEALLERETLGRDEIEAIMAGRELPPSITVSIPTYAEKRRESEEKKKGAIFQPRPHEVPSAG